MILTEKQIEYIANNLEFYGIRSEELHNDLLDHICTHIESGDFQDFEIAYKDALQTFGGYTAISNLEKDTYMLVTFRKNLKRQKLVYIFGFISITAFLTGSLFKVMHWPGASIMLVLCFMILVFAFLPLYFYQRYQIYYKKTIQR